MRKLFVVALGLSLMVAVACKEAPKAGGGQQQGGVGGQPIVSADSEIALLKKVLQDDPKNLNALIKLGNTYMDGKKFQEAIDHYSRALEIAPKNVDLRVDMGTSYRYLGRPDRAMEEYRKAMAIEPNHVNAHLNAGVVLQTDLHDKQGAIKEFEKFVELAPNSPLAEQIRQELKNMKAGGAAK